MTSQIQATIRQYLASEFTQDRADFELKDDTNLLVEHVIDSLGIFILITFLEEQYGISIDADEVLIENFETVADIGRLVETKLEPAATGTTTG
jgi:acyl carrier protein